MTIKYMHTLFGKPAFFQDYQIVYAGMKLKFSDLRDSLKDIREEQTKSSEWRRKKGYYDNPTEYGYIRIKME